MTRTGVVAGAFVALEILCRIGTIPRVTMIPPTEMVVALWQILHSGTSEQAISPLRPSIRSLRSRSRSFWAFGLAPRCTRCRALRRVFEPLLSAYYAVPVFIFYPLLIVAFGVGRTALIAMGAMFGIVAMIVNTMTGLDRVPPSSAEPHRS